MNASSVQTKIYQAAYASHDLRESHAETLKHASAPGQSELGASLSTADGILKFEWLDVELSARVRFVVHPLESLVLEYPFTHVKGEKEMHVVSLFKNADGQWFRDAACTQRVRGALRQGNEGMEVIAAALLESPLMQPLEPKPAT